MGCTVLSFHYFVFLKVYFSCWGEGEKDVEGDSKTS